APSLEPQTGVLIGCRRQATQLFSFVEFRLTMQIREQRWGKAGPFCGPQMAETAGFLNQVELQTFFSAFPLLIRIQEQRSGERAESAGKAPFSERLTVAALG